MIFTIDAIEGNSHIGVPVFSRSAKKSNYDYLVFSPPREVKMDSIDENYEGRGGENSVS